jgi:MoaA/NifB/PqqE/SkfB family radical SAM enzyme
VNKKIFKLGTKLLTWYYPTPPYLILFLTDKCWTKCRHCWFNEDWKAGNLKSSVLTYDELEKIASSTKRISFISYTGGEAFLRDDFVDITHMFATNTKLTRYDTPTSGFDTDLILQKTEKILNMSKNIPFRINISLDGTAETHDFIRGRNGSFKNAVETAGQLRKLKKKYNYFDVGIITTISNHNQHEVKDISEIVRKILPDGEWMVNLTRFIPREPSAVQVNPENYYLACEIIDQRIKNKDFIGDTGYSRGKWLTAKNIVRRQVISDIISNNYHGLCAAGVLACVIYHDGTVSPCESDSMNIGNIRDYNFDLHKLMYSKQGKAIIRNIQDSCCICTHECFLSVSLLVNLSRIVRQRLKL